MADEHSSEDLIDRGKEHDRIPPRVRSETSYPVDQLDLDEKKALLDATTYHAAGPEQFIIDKIPATITDLFTSLPQSIPNGELGLGDLRRFPNEILQMILRRADIASLIRFRRVNRHARLMVGTLPEYRDVMTHASTAFLALVKLRLCSQFTISQLEATLYDDKCIACGDTAPFVFLPTIARCCSKCLVEDNKFIVYKMHHPSNPNAGMPDDFKESRLNSMEYPNFNPRVPLKMLSLPGHLHYGSTSRFESRMELHMSGPEHPMLNDERYDRCRKSCCWRIYRTMATAAMPFLDRRTSQSSPAVHCWGCEHSGSLDNGPDLRNLHDLCHSYSGYFGHFRWCRRAQELWEDSRKGVQDAPIPLLEDSKRWEEKRRADAVCRRREYWDSFFFSYTILELGSIIAGSWAS